MAELALRTKNLSKVYRLYRKPLHRMLDLFGLLPRRLGLYTEHMAVNGINIEIQRGEKVAIIGRNGAGKSTLLKMISGVITPSMGEIEVNGTIHALLNLGTGFHQDFTGRENIYSYLAHLGIVGEPADRHFHDIADFAELNEYIDQPIKTYSAGMGMRLAFAASTVIDPDLLIIDEVLSVGDAYFFRKSFERVKELCNAHGSTLLMVTHDVYAAMTFCERCIWIDHGAVRADGPIKQVVAAYEGSIRDQEEVRLRQRHLASIRDNLERTNQEAALFGEFVMPDGQPPQANIALSYVKFLSGGSEIGTLTMEDVAPEQANHLLPNMQDGNWGELEEVEGRLARRFLPHGSIFHKLPVMLAKPEVVAAALAGQLDVVVGYHASGPVEVEFRIRRVMGERLLGYSWTCQTEGWTEILLTQLDQPAMIRQLPSSVAARHGQRAMEITSVAFCDADGTEKLQYEIDAPMRVNLRYRLNRVDFDECPTIIVAFQKNGVLRTHRFFTEDVRLRAADGVTGSLEIMVPRLLISAGNYLITVSVFAEGYFRSEGPKKFFTANDQLYDMHSRSYEILVAENRVNPLFNDVVFLHPTEWRCQPDQIADRVDNEPQP